VRSRRSSRQIPLKIPLTLDHILDELELVLHCVQKLLRHLAAPGDRVR
jgi:hypothetical protein